VEEEEEEKKKMISVWNSQEENYTRNITHAYSLSLNVT
jgi:hypothetical protein